MNPKHGTSLPAFIEKCAPRVIPMNNINRHVVQEESERMQLFLLTHELMHKKYSPLTAVSPTTFPPPSGPLLQGAPDEDEFIDSQVDPTYHDTDEHLQSHLDAESTTPLFTQPEVVYPHINNDGVN